jgi:hypothetical protein
VNSVVAATFFLISLSFGLPFLVEAQPRVPPEKAYGYVLPPPTPDTYEKNNYVKIIKDERGRFVGRMIRQGNVVLYYDSAGSFTQKMVIQGDLLHSYNNLGTYVGKVRLHQGLIIRDANKLGANLGGRARFDQGLATHGATDSGW